MKILSNRVDITALIFIVTLLASGVAKAADGDAAVFVPTSAWLVGPASLGKIEGGTSNQVPCVVANQFSNGFILRLSGGGDQLMAMALDFRQKAFTPRKKYDVEFSVPGQFFQVLSGAAYDEGTLLFSLYKFPDFYKSLKSADTLSVKVGDASVALNLIGLNDGFRRMNDCYAPNLKPVQRDASTFSPQKSSGQNPLITQASGGLTPMPGETSSASDNRPDPEMSVNAVLNNGRDVPSPAGGSASDLIAGAKQSEETAKQLAATNPMNKPAAPAPQLSSPVPARVRPPSDVMFQQNNVPQAAMDGTQDMRWRALKGADLHDVLDDWARGSGIKLMWLPVQNFAVQRSVSMSGDVKAAVAALLEQYADQPVRPVGRIYREPGATSLVLVVEQVVENRE